MLSGEGYASIGGAGLSSVHLSCNDGRRIATQHFAENKRTFYDLTLHDSRDIYILTYPHIWGIDGRGIERAFVVLSSELTNNGYLTIYRQYGKVTHFNSF